MEAPAVKGEKIIKNYSVISDKNRKFLINIINNHDSIFLSAICESEIKKDEYKKECKLEELKKIKYLSILDSIDDIFEEIINLFEKKSSEIKIIEETNKILINIPLEGKIIKDIILSLDLKVKSTEEKYDELYNLFNI